MKVECELFPAFPFCADSHHAGLLPLIASARLAEIQIDLSANLEGCFVAMMQKL